MLLTETFLCLHRDPTSMTAIKRVSIRRIWSLVFELENTKLIPVKLVGLLIAHTPFKHFYEPTSNWSSHVVDFCFKFNDIEYIGIQAMFDQVQWRGDRSLNVFKILAIGIQIIQFSALNWFPQLAMNELFSWSFVWGIRSFTVLVYNSVN